MPQKKINNFFNSYGKSIISNSSKCFQGKLSSYQTKAMQWNNQSTRPNQALQRYHNSRKQQKMKQLNEQLPFCRGGSEWSTPSNSQMMEDSQNFPTSSQSQDSMGWNQRSCQMGNFATKRSWSSFQLSNHLNSHKMFSEPAIKKECRQFSEQVKQEEKERDERQMLHNFLMSAKQCCEDANDIARNVGDKLDAVTADIINKMKECLEVAVPQLLTKIVENNKEKEEMLLNKVTEISKKLKEKEERLSDVEEKLLNEIEKNGDKCIEEVKKVAKDINETNQVHKIAMDLLQEMQAHLKKPKPLLCEISTQYSPQFQQYKTNVNPSKSCTFASPVSNETICSSQFDSVFDQRRKHISSPVAKVSPVQLSDERILHEMNSPALTSIYKMDSDSSFKTPTPDLARIISKKSFKEELLNNKRKIRSSEKMSVQNKPDPSDNWFSQKGNIRGRKVRKQKKQPLVEVKNVGDKQISLKSGYSGAITRRQSTSTQWHQVESKRMSRKVQDKLDLSWMIAGRSSDSEDYDDIWTFGNSKSNNIKLL